MFCILIVTNGVFKGYVQGAGGHHNYPIYIYIYIYMPLCLWGIDSCIYKDMLKWNKNFFLHKLVAAWMGIMLIFFISNVFWMLANITFESSHCFWKGNRNSKRWLCIMVCPSFWEDLLYVYLHPLLGADELNG
jgi:hypothetical protein